MPEGLLTTTMKTKTAPTKEKKNFVKEIKGAKTRPKNPTPKFKDIKGFDTEEAFNEWLKKTASIIICFAWGGQDLTKIWVASSGEILHADMQVSVWNGAFVDLKSLTVGFPIQMYNYGKWQEMGRLTVETIEMLKPE